MGASSLVVDTHTLTVVAVSVVVGGCDAPHTVSCRSALVVVGLLWLVGVGYAVGEGDVLPEKPGIWMPGVVEAQSGRRQEWAPAHWLRRLAVSWIRARKQAEENRHSDALDLFIGLEVWHHDASSA